ncbi:MAG: DUF1080 domain-containing protein, partial [Verrucomicrobiota bacterium]
PAPPKKTPPTGYTDTPLIPGQKWRVHDDARPRPAIVRPGETFSHGAQPPSDAHILFDGTNLDGWSTRDGEDPGWKVENGYMECVPKSGTLVTRDEFGDFQLHLEFATPAIVDSASQGRGNSGVIIYGRYEVQILDSFENKTYADGQAGAMYGQYPPLRNASKGPGMWQSYDIIFETPRWDGEVLVKPGNVTVIHNGVVLHHKKEYLGAVAHKRTPSYTPHPPQGKISLQDHNNAIRYRNIWIRSLGDYDESSEESQ